MLVIPVGAHRALANRAKQGFAVDLGDKVGRRGSASRRASGICYRIAIQSIAPRALRKG